MRYFIFFFFLIYSFPVWSYNVYYRADKHAMNVPDRYARDLDTLTDYLVKPFKGDELMTTRVIYVWISLNILYDDYELRNKYEEKSNDNSYTPQDTFQKRSGVCRHFAGLFEYMARRAGLNALSINGFAFDGSHTWNAVKINKEWQLLDTTSRRRTFTNIKNDREYAKAIKKKMKQRKHPHFTGGINEEYFLPPPSKMIETHYPIALEYQFLKKPIPPDFFLLTHPKFRKNKDFIKFTNNFKKKNKNKKP